MVAAMPLSAVVTGLVVSYFVPAAFQWVSMVPFMFVLLSFAEKAGKVRVKRAYGLGFLYFYPYYLVVWYWFLTMYPLDFTGLSKGAALVAVLFAWLGLPLLQAVFAAWQVPLFLLASGSRLFKWGRSKLLAPVVYGLIYVVFEWAQTLTWAGVPWGRLAIGQAFSPVFLGAASLFGSYFITFVIVTVNGYIASALLSRKDSTELSSVSLGLAAAIFAVNLSTGAIINVCREADDAERRVSVGVLQGNVSSVDKWADDGFYNLTNIYGRLTTAAAEDGADIVLWTETSLPYVLNEYSFLENFVSNAADVNDVTLLATGFWKLQTESGEYGEYNAVMTVSPEGEIDKENIYCKRRLVPFGEFVPYENLVKTLVPPLASLAMFESAVATGDSARVQNTEYGMVGALVCFDSIYEDFAREAVNDGAELLTVSTNDSWFGESAALYQHTAQAVLRAIETDRYVARAGNTGYSCIISPSGEVMQVLPINTEGYFVADVYMRDTVTLYSIIGNAFVLLAAIVVAVLLADLFIYNKMKKKNAAPKTVFYVVKQLGEAELDAAVSVYDDGRRAIGELGIDQWQDGYPSRDVTESDIESGMLWAVCDKLNGKISAVAVVMPAPDHDYDVIDGEWLSEDGGYVAVHRVATAEAYRGCGAAGYLFERIEQMAKEAGAVSLRVDTHRGNNVMQKFLEKRGFSRCGKITLSHGDGDRVRLAYEKLL